MLTVFDDAKCGTVSAWSWPSHEAAFQRGKQFLDNVTSQEFSEDFRYSFPASHGIC